MNTALENKIETTGTGESLNTLELEGELLLELLEGVSSHAGRDKSLIKLNAVEVEGGGAAIKVYFTGEGKPMRVRITSDTINWRALLMPMRYTD